MKVISFMNPKGGVGKTSLCAEAAIYAHKVLGLRTVVFDTDINGSLIDFNADRSEKLPDLSFPDTISHCAANIDRQIKTLSGSGKYDICIVDCHGDWGQLENNLLWVTDLVVMPTIADIKSVRPTIKGYLDRMKDIIDDRDGELQHTVVINNIRKNHGQAERDLLKALDESDVNLCPLKVYTAPGIFRDTWSNGLTVLDVYLMGLSPRRYENPGTNIKQLMEHIYGLIVK